MHPESGVLTEHFAAAPPLPTCARGLQGQYLHTLVALGMGAWSLIVYAALVVLQLRPLWEAQYIIPVLGMLLVRAVGALQGACSLRGACLRIA